VGSLSRRSLGRSFAADCPQRARTGFVPSGPSAKTLVTTPNSDVIYAMSYLDLGKDGPMVFEAPPGLQGILLDFWQRPIPGPKIGATAYFGDVGLLGPEAGKGGDSPVRSVPAPTDQP
jgi:hypothetical protein